MFRKPRPKRRGSSTRDQADQGSTGDPEVAYRFDDLAERDVPECPPIPDAQLFHPSRTRPADTPEPERDALWHTQWVQCGTCGQVISAAYPVIVEHFDMHANIHR